MKALSDARLATMDEAEAAGGEFLRAVAELSGELVEKWLVLAHPSGRRLKLKVPAVRSLARVRIRYKRIELGPTSEEIGFEGLGELVLVEFLR